MLILALFQVVALKGATVHSMVPGEQPEVATVLVEEGHFLAVGPEVEIPADAEVVDLSGKHLVPGLIDGMVHHDMEHDPLYVLSGVTLVRDMGNDMSRIFLAAMPNARNRMPGPQLLIAGAIFDGVPPATTEAVVVRDLAEVEDKLPRLFERGIQLASFHTGIPEPAWHGLIEGAHELDLQVWGPIPACSDLDGVLGSGQDGLAYLEGFGAAEDEDWDVERVRERVARYAAEGVAAMPLMNVYGYRTEDQGDDPPIFNYLAPYYADWWRADLVQRRGRFSDEYRARGRRHYERLQEIVLEMWKAGVPLLVGSAAPNPWMLPGQGLIDELEAWQAAGIPASELLGLATRGAAEILGVADERGTIEVGRIADAVVFEKDPALGASSLREPVGVLLRGGYMDQDFLARWRQALLDAQQEATELASKPVIIEKPKLPDGRVVLSGRVEGRAFERVVAAEEYWVVRTFEGPTAWCSRMVMPGGLGQGAAVHTLKQSFEDGRLLSFDLDIDNGDIHYRVEGLHIGGQFRLKRWLNEQYVDTNSTSARPHVVDAGMSLPAMVLSHYRKDGPCTALYFEGMDPVMAGWELQRGENGVLAVKTGKGPMVVTFEATGALAKLGRVEGQATVRYESVASDAFGGPGMPPLPAPEPEPEEPEVPDEPDEGDSGEDG
jgi:hypothetical protein